MKNEINKMLDLFYANKHLYNKIGGDNMREGIKHIKDELVVPRFNDEEEQSKCDATAEEYLFAELGDKLMQIAKDCDVAIHIQPIVKSDMTCPFEKIEREIRAEVYYRPFTFCKNCSLFTELGFNGGVCTKNYEEVHILDGCTKGDPR